MVVKMNSRVRLAVRDATCSACKMHRQAEGEDVCVTASGNHRARILIVGKSPWSEKGLKEITTYLTRAGFDLNEIAYTSAIKCRVWDMAASRTDVKTCKPYLVDEIGFIKPEWVITLGNEALSAATGKSGITKHRGITYSGPHGVKVVATISPAAVYRNPGQKGGFEADLLYIRKLTEGRDVEEENTIQRYHVVDTKEKLKELNYILDAADGVSFDIESTGFNEFDPSARLVCICFTVWSPDSVAPVATLALPLYHPESPWQTQWRKVLRIVGPHFTSIRKRIAHNGKFDCRWLAQFGVIADLTFDTMIAAHQLDENRPKGLKPLARQVLNAPPWAMDTKELLNEPLEEVLEYCAYDTYHAARLYFVFREELKKKENRRKARIFTRVLMPAANRFISVERAGVWIDREQMMTNWHICNNHLTDLNNQLMEYVPDDWQAYGHKKINFGPSNFLRWYLFDHLELPILKRGKTKDNGAPGSPSVAEAVMLALQGQHPAIDILLERSKWYKYSTAFFSAYAELIDSNDRIHTTFKVTGAVTGRLSSGKEDAEKITSRKQIRGVNLQQVPRDPFVRGIFGAPEGSTFIEADYSQIELRIAAHLANEREMLSLYAQGVDIHMAMAMRLTSKPMSEVTVHERKMAKAVNFGFLYGMGWAKFIATALANYGLIVSKEEAIAAREAFFQQFPDLLPWHAKQRRLAAKFKRVESPIGRVRHLPDIDSPENDVRAEAQRQAINSPVQAMASDLALISFIRVSNIFDRLDLRTHAIGTVHDAINFEAPNDELARVLPIIKDTMESVPLKQMFGVELNVPIISDLKIGQRWGGAKELTPEQVYDFDPYHLLEA